MNVVFLCVLKLYFVFSASENETQPREMEELRGSRIRQAKFGQNSRMPFLIIVKQG